MKQAILFIPLVCCPPPRLVGTQVHRQKYDAFPFVPLWAGETRGGRRCEIPFFFLLLACCRVVSRHCCIPWRHAQPTLPNESDCRSYFAFSSAFRASCFYFECFADGTCGSTTHQDDDNRIELFRDCNYQYCPDEGGSFLPRLLLCLWLWD